MSDALIQPQIRENQRIATTGVVQMRRLLLSATLAAFMIAPVQAADWRQSQAAEAQTGAFIGARVQLSLGGKVASRPRTALTIAPTQSRISNTGMVRTSIGEGVALNFGPQSKPTLTLAGIRADTALGLRPQEEVDGDRTLGVSKGGKIAIGVGAALLVGAAAGYVVLSNRCTECDQ